MNFNSRAIAMLGLVLEGGAMRAGFTAGALMALMDKKLTDFDAAAAVSASVPKKLWEAAQIYNSQVSLLELMARENPSRALIICPDKMPPVKFVTLDRKKINHTIDLGYEKVEELEENIRRFLGKGV